MSRTARCTILFFIFMMVQENILAQEIKNARIQGFRRVDISYSGKINPSIISEWKLRPALTIEKIESHSGMITIFTAEPFQLDEHYYLDRGSGEPVFLVPDGILDSLYSDKKLGYDFSGDSIVFRIFAPRAKWVRLVLFDHHQDQSGEECMMERDEQGVQMS